MNFKGQLQEARCLTGPKLTHGKERGLFVGKGTLVF
jgi:hypothetical protein